MSPAPQQGGVGRHLVPVAFCALAGHLALYGSLVPTAGNHGYLAWYEPLVAGLSLGGTAAFAGLLLMGAFGPRRVRRRAISLLVPLDVRLRPSRLAIASVVLLVCQESIERSVSEGRLAPAAFEPSQGLFVVAVVAAAALLIALVGRICSRLAALVALRRERTRRRSGAAPLSRRRALRCRHPLAELPGLRAPPLSC